MTRLRPPGKKTITSVRTERVRSPLSLFDAREGLLECVLFAFAQSGLVEQVAENELAPVALRFDEPRRAVVRLRASSVSCSLRVPSVPMRVSSLVTPVFESDCASSTFSRNSLICARSGESRLPSSFWLPSEKVFDFARECPRPEPGTGRRGFSWRLEQFDFFAQVLAFVVQFGFELADARMQRGFIWLSCNRDRREVPQYRRSASRLPPCVPEPGIRIPRARMRQPAPAPTCPEWQ